MFFLTPSFLTFVHWSGRGMYDLLLNLDLLLQSSLDRAAEVRVVQLDFLGEFDRVDHSGLIYKLKSVFFWHCAECTYWNSSLVADDTGSVWTVALVDGRMLCLVYLRVVSWGLFSLCCTLLICLTLSTVMYTVMQTIRHRWLLFSAHH